LSAIGTMLVDESP